MSSDAGGINGFGLASVLFLLVNPIYIYIYIYLFIYFISLKIFFCSFIYWIDLLKKRIDQYIYIYIYIYSIDLKYFEGNKAKCFTVIRRGGFGFVKESTSWASSLSWSASEADSRKRTSWTKLILKGKRSLNICGLHWQILVSFIKKNIITSQQ